jgi:hypothetical protein
VATGGKTAETIGETVATTGGTADADAIGAPWDVHGLLMIGSGLGAAPLKRRRGTRVRLRDHADRTQGSSGAASLSPGRCCSRI